MSFNKTIRTLVRKALLEAKEHQDDEMIDFNEISLQQEYDKLNALLFNNELKTVPMKWNNRRTAGGAVRAFRNSAWDDIRIRELAISKFLEIPYKLFKDVLAHEMIHVKFLQDGNFKEGHGYGFQAEMHRINNMGLGFNITTKMENTDVFNVSKHMQTNQKELIAILTNTNKDKNRLTVTTPSVWDRDGHVLETFYKKLVRIGKYSEMESTVIKTNNPRLIRYPKKRTFARGVSYSIIDDDFAKELLEDGDIIKTFDGSK